MEIEEVWAAGIAEEGTQEAYIDALGKERLGIVAPMPLPKIKARGEEPVLDLQSHAGASHRLDTLAGPTNTVHKREIANDMAFDDDRLLPDSEVARKLQQRMATSVELNRQGTQPASFLEEQEEGARSALYDGHQHRREKRVHMPMTRRAAQPMYSQGRETTKGNIAAPAGERVAPRVVGAHDSSTAASQGRKSSQIPDAVTPSASVVMNAIGSHERTGRDAPRPSEADLSRIARPGDLIPPSRPELPEHGAAPRRGQEERSVAAPMSGVRVSGSNDMELEQIALTSGTAALSYQAVVKAASTLGDRDATPARAAVANQTGMAAMVAAAAQIISGSSDSQQAREAPREIAMQGEVAAAARAAATLSQFGDSRQSMLHGKTEPGSYALSAAASTYFDPTSHGALDRTEERSAAAAVHGSLGAAASARARDSGRDTQHIDATRVGVVEHALRSMQGLVPRALKTSNIRARQGTETRAAVPARSGEVSTSTAEAIEGRRGHRTGPARSMATPRANSYRWSADDSQRRDIGTGRRGAEVGGRAGAMARALRDADQLEVSAELGKAGAAARAPVGMAPDAWRSGRETPAKLARGTPLSFASSVRPYIVQRSQRK